MDKDKATEDRSHTSNRVKGSRWLKVLVSVLIILIFLCFVSSFTAVGMWDGAFPPGEYHLKIVDQNRKPVQGASMSVYDASNKISYEYPVDNYFSESSLVSDEQGIIIALHKNRGFEFGGGCWNALWFFPICSGSPKYHGQISAEGYKTIKFSIDKLFDLAYDGEEAGTTTVTLENGKVVEISIYETTFTLKK